jgi:hypothetical protein
MLRKAHSVFECIIQVGEISFGKRAKWYAPMAAALDIPRCELDDYMRTDWTDDQIDQLNRFLADLLEDRLEKCPRQFEGNIGDIMNLAAQYRALRHRPHIPTPDTQEFIQRSDDATGLELDLPPEILMQFKELLKDD